MGVALTWGIEVLPIRQEDTDLPASDISGQTWATYVDSAARFTADDQQHRDRVGKMVERVLRAKRLATKA